MLASVNKGLLPIICDAGMRGLAEELNPKGFNDFCNWHSIQRVGVRSHQDCLELFDPDQSDKLKKIMKFCTKAGKDLSQKKMKEMKLRSSHARGINSYLDGLELNDELRLRICRFTHPKGWQSKFNDPEEDLCAEETRTKRKIMMSRKIVPKIKVITRLRILSYSITYLKKLQKPKEVRPRTLIDTLNALMIAQPIFMNAKNDPDHALYPHVQDLPNYVHIEALQILYSQLEVFTNFFDSSNNFNVSIQ